MSQLEDSVSEASHESPVSVPDVTEPAADPDNGAAGHGRVEDGPSENDVLVGAPAEDVPLAVSSEGEAPDEATPSTEDMLAEAVPPTEDTLADAVPLDPVVTGAVTPPDPTPPPIVEAGEADLDAPEIFLNRELTWLNFNFRVLQEANDPRTPLLERLKFVAIVSSNLDEFFMKRIGGLKQQVGARVQERTIDGRTPEEQIEASYAVIRELVGRKRAIQRKVLGEMREHDIRLTTFDQLSEEDQTYLRDHYVENIYPLVTPQSTDPAHPFPFVSNLSLNLLVTLRHPGEMENRFARVKVPVGVGIPRLLSLSYGRTFVTLESVMAQNLELLFPGMEIQSCELFRVTRNANTEQDEETAHDLVDLIESELRERKLAPIVRLEVEGGMDPTHRGMLAAELGLDEQSDVFEVHGMLGTRDLIQMLAIDMPDLRDPQFHPFDHPDLTTDRSIFHTIREKGALLVHHPYQAFTSSVERFLQEASQDPKVRAIKMTFYRTSDDSKAIGYLMDAARNGKQVAVVMELKASFDEEANLRWAAHLGRVGIHVTYGVLGLKTHCKVILVVRQDYDGLRRYAHIGTGNYHSDTARLYTDLGMMTCDDDIGRDLTELFNYLTTGYKPKRDYRRIKVAPKGLRRAILDGIETEIEHQRGGGQGHLQFKMNAMEDPAVTRALYRASLEGVKVDLIVRDSCRIRPGIVNLSETISVISVVGRFLEHSRIYYFRNGGDVRYYIASADCMRRNLQSRVEVMAPVDDPRLQEQLRTVLDTILGDRRQAWEMHADGSYTQRLPQGDVEELGSHERFMRWAEAEHRKATRLKRRQVRGLLEGNLPR